MNKADVEDLFNLYHIEYHGVSVLETGNINFEKFAEAINRFFYDKSICQDQFCRKCEKPTGIDRNAEGLCRNCACICAYNDSEEMTSHAKLCSVEWKP